MNREGTLIHGTYRLEDLIPAFMGEIDAIKEELSLAGGIVPDEFGRMDDTLGEIERRQETEGYYDSEDAAWDVEELLTILNDLAPEGFYFGANDGDGTDFGFWRVDEWGEG